MWQWSTYLRHGLLATNFISLRRFHRLGRWLDRLPERNVVDLLPRGFRGLRCWTILNRGWRRWCRGASPDSRRRHLWWTVPYRSGYGRCRNRGCSRGTWQCARHVLLARLLLALRFLALIARIIIVALAGRVASHVLLLGLLVHRLHLVRERKSARRVVWSQRPERTWCRVVPGCSRSKISYICGICEVFDLGSAYVFFMPSLYNS